MFISQACDDLFIMFHESSIRILTGLFFVDIVRTEVLTPSLVSGSSHPELVQAVAER